MSLVTTDRDMIADIQEALWPNSMRNAEGNVVVLFEKATIASDKVRLDTFTHGIMSIPEGGVWHTLPRM